MHINFSNRPRNMYAVMDYSIGLFNRCTVQMCGAEAPCVLIVRASLALALTAIAMFEKHCPDSEEFDKLACKDQAFLLLDETLRKWIDDYHVIGKEMFGGYIAKEGIRRNTKLARVDNEIVVGIFSLLLIHLSAVMNLVFWFF